MGKDRVPPHDLDAEESLLGSMLLTQDAIREAVLCGVRGRDFYKPAHTAIWAALVGLYEHGQPTDPVTVAAELKAANGQQAPSREALLRIQAAAPAAANAGRYARIVTDHATVRQLLLQNDDVREALWDPSVPVDEKLGRVESLVRDADLPLVAGGPSPTLDEYLDAHREALPWLIPDTLRRRERLLIVAEPGIGKTTLSRQWGLQLSMGVHPWTALVKTDACRSLIVDCENDEDGASEEINDLVIRARKHGGYDPDRIRVEFRTEGIDVLSRRDAMWLRERLAANRPDVLVLGPLYKLHNINDKDGQEAKRVLDALDDLRKRFDVALILETHAPKECWSIRGDKAQPLHIKGAAEWTQWPEFVFGLVDEGSGGSAYWHPVRPPRYKTRRWPGRLRKNGPRWPWEATGDL